MIDQWRPGTIFFVITSEGACDLAAQACTEAAAC